MGQYTNQTFGEPLNVIISALSDPFIMTDEGFRLYTKYVLVDGFYTLAYTFQFDRIFCGMSGDTHRCLA